MNHIGGTLIYLSKRSHLFHGLPYFETHPCHLEGAAFVCVNATPHEGLLPCRYGSSKRGTIKLWFSFWCLFETLKKGTLMAPSYTCSML